MTFHKTSTCLLVKIELIVWQAKKKKLPNLTPFSFFTKSCGNTSIMESFGIVVSVFRVAVWVV